MEQGLSLPHDRSAYDADYAAVGHAKRIADHYGTVMVLVHHVRKAGSDDFLTVGLISSFDAVSAAAARWGFDEPWMLPVRIDVAIPVFTVANLLLIRLDMALAWARFVPWALTLSPAGSTSRRTGRVGQGGARHDAAAVGRVLRDRRAHLRRSHRRGHRPQDGEDPVAVHVSQANARKLRDTLKAERAGDGRPLHSLEEAATDARQSDASAEAA